MYYRKFIFSSNLWFARQAAGLTQSELAKRAGLSVSTVQRAESAQTWPEFDTRHKLKEALNGADIHRNLDRVNGRLFLRGDSWFRDSDQIAIIHSIEVDEGVKRATFDLTWSIPIYRGLCGSPSPFGQFVAMRDRYLHFHRVIGKEAPPPTEEEIEQMSFTLFVVSRKVDRPGIYARAVPIEVEQNRLVVEFSAHWTDEVLYAWVKQRYDLDKEITKIDNKIKDLRTARKKKAKESKALTAQIEERIAEK